MRARFPLLVLVLVADALLQSCANDDPVATPGPGNQLNTSPRPNREAEEAALWMSGELVAPAGLYAAIRRDLKAIRDEYTATMPVVTTEFQPWWQVSQVGLQVSEGLRNALLTGMPTSLDDLNQSLGATRVDLSRLSDRPIVYIDFAGRLNSERLADTYQTVEGVLAAWPNGVVLGQRSADLYPWKHDGVMTYLFRAGYGDCPAGCIHNTFWYFRRVNGKTELVGTFAYRDEPAPAWWDEAGDAFFRYLSGE